MSNNIAYKIGDIVFVQTQVLINGTNIHITGYTDIVANETTTRKFIRTFRYSLDGIHFSDWMSLINPNLALITGNANGLVFFEFNYTRAGSDTTSTLEFQGLTLTGNLTVQIVHNTASLDTIFEDLVANNAITTSVAQNLLKKMYNSGIVPQFIERGEGVDDKDYVAFWSAVSTYFAYFIAFMTKFDQIFFDKKYLKEYMKQKGIFFAPSPYTTFGELQYLSESFYDEIRQRGTIQVVKRKNTNNFPIKTRKEEVKKCITFIVDNHNNVWSYDFVSGDLEKRFSFSSSIAADIACTADKIFVNDGNSELKEYDITSLNPLTITYNRTIPYVFSADGIGLAAIDNNNILTGRNEINKVVIDANGNVSSETTLFTLNGQIQGDFVYISATNTIIVTWTDFGVGDAHFTEFMMDGTIVNDIIIPNYDAYGLAYDGNYFYGTGDGDIFRYDPTINNFVFDRNIGIVIYGMAQNPTCYIDIKTICECCLEKPLEKSRAINGEWLRLINIHELWDEFIFDNMKMVHMGWNVGHSSPCYHGTNQALNVNKTKESKKTFISKCNYDLLHEDVITLEDDLDDEGNPIKVMKLVGNDDEEIVGIGFNLDSQPTVPNPDKVKDNSHNKTKGWLVGLNKPVYINSFSGSNFKEALEWTDPTDKGDDTSGVWIPNMKGLLSVSPTTRKFTMESRFSLDANQLIKPIYTKWKNGGNNADNDFWYGIDTNRPTFKYFDNTGALQTFQPTQVLVPGNAYEIALQYNGTKLQWFINGVKDSLEITTGLRASDGIAKGYIGRTETGTTGNITDVFFGPMDEIRISNVDRYSANYSVFGQEFIDDAASVAIYHLNIPTIPNNPLTPVALLPNQDIIVDNTVDYEITFSIKRIGPNTGEFHFGVLGLNKDDVVKSKAFVSIEGTPGFENTFIKDINKFTQVQNEYYFFRGIIYANGSISAHDHYYTKLNNGLQNTTALAFNSFEDIHKIAPCIYIKSNDSTEVYYIKDYKVRPLIRGRNIRPILNRYSNPLPPSEGYRRIIDPYVKNPQFLQVGTIAYAWEKDNNENYTELEIEELVQEFLIPYNTLLVSVWLPKRILGQSQHTFTH